MTLFGKCFISSFVQIYVPLLLHGFSPSAATAAWWNGGRLQGVKMAIFWPLTEMSAQVLGQQVPSLSLHCPATVCSQEGSYGEEYEVPQIPPGHCTGLRRRRVFTR